MTSKWIITVLVAAGLLAAGTAAGGFFAGHGIVQARLADRSVTVKGLAEKPVRADLATWTLRFTATGDALEEVQAEMERGSAAVRTFLSEAGFAAEEIVSERLEVTDVLTQPYRQGRLSGDRYILASTLTVRSHDIDRVAAAGNRIGALVRQGVVVTDNGGPAYFYTGLNGIKPDMIADATRNAREAAARFAADSGSAVGAIRRASQGVFQILPRNRGAGAERASIEKTVRVVSTVTYALDL